MNYNTLKTALHTSLDDLLKTCEKLDPADGIVDLKLSFMSVDAQTDVSTTLDSNIELVEDVDGFWDVEAKSVWTTTHTTHFDE